MHTFSAKTFPTGVTAMNGVLYGTGNGSGALSNGFVFSVTTAGNERVIYRFKGGADGFFPRAVPTAFKDKLYGTTSAVAPGAAERCT